VFVWKADLALRSRGRMFGMMMVWSWRDSTAGRGRSRHRVICTTGSIRACVAGEEYRERVKVEFEKEDGVIFVRDVTISKRLKPYSVYSQRLACISTPFKDIKLEYI
jgi:hypothetical protein